MKKLKSQIVKILKKNNVVKAGIFSSYARGEEKKNSDIDFLVKFENISADNFFGLMFLLEKLFKRKIDLIKYNSIHPLIKKEVLKEEIRII